MRQIDCVYEKKEGQDFNQLCLSVTVTYYKHNTINKANVS